MRHKRGDTIVCCHCQSEGTFPDDCDRFIPEFWTGDRYEGPMCDGCASKYLVVDEGGEMVTKYRPIFNQNQPGLIMGYVEGMP